jgi:hypothetical protein
MRGSLSCPRHRLSIIESHLTHGALNCGNVNTELVKLTIDDDGVGMWVWLLDIIPWCSIEVCALGVVTVDHPPVNALSTQVLSDLFARLREAEANVRVKGIVLCGARNVFLAGADIKEMQQRRGAPETKSSPSMFDPLEVGFVVCHIAV